MNKFALNLIASSAILASIPGPLHAQSAYPTRNADQVTLNFVGAEIADVARTIAVMTSRNVVVDPRVKGTMNLVTDRPISKAAAYNQFLSTLRLQGYTVVEADGLYKVVPEADAKLQTGIVNVGSARLGGSQIVTQIFRLNYQNPNNLVPVLRPLISPNNTINVDPANNALIITDYADNLKRLGQIVNNLDLPNASGVEIIPLHYAVASDLVTLVTKLTDTGVAGAAAPGQVDSSFKTTVLADTRSNSIILRAANPARTRELRSLIEQLDRPDGLGPSGNIYVVHLKNADATKLAAILRASLAADNRGSSVSGGGSTPATARATPQAAATASNNSAGSSAASTQPVAASAEPSTGGTIQADPSTNSLIISAPEPQYRQLLAVINKLDNRRAQVYVEALIVEVDENKASQFGVQWQTLLNNSNSGTVAAAGTNFGTGGSNIWALNAAGSSGSVTPPVGFNIGTLSHVAGKTILSSLANFLETSGVANVLSKPTLLTLDNEEAKIVVGQNVPFVTGQYTTANTSSGSVNPFQTIDRKDVGLTLRVKPQISEDGTIKMTIYQEVSSVLATSTTNASGPTTNKRSIESSVVVDDGQVVAIGGLLQDEYDGSDSKIPGAGDIPVLGNLFKSTSRTRTKTNLMVFLRPLVVRNEDDAANYSSKGYQSIRGIQVNTLPPAAKTQIDVDGPVIDPLPLSLRMAVPPNADYSGTNGQIYTVPSPSITPMPLPSKP